MSPVSDSDVLGAWAWPREHLHRVPEILLLAQCCLLGITVFTHTMYKGEKSLDSMFCWDADSVTLHDDILGDIECHRVMSLNLNPFCSRSITHNSTVKIEEYQRHHP